MKSFTYVSLPSRVVFGAGSVARLPQEVDKLGAKRALVLSTPGRAADAKRLTAPLGERFAGIYDRAVMHVPVEIAEDARRAARDLGADCCVAVGGGSTIGLGKAIALTTGLPVIAVPTTYSGSEMTSAQGFVEGGIKTVKLDPKMQPRTVIYDPELPRRQAELGRQIFLQDARQGLVKHLGIAVGECLFSTCQALAGFFSSPRKTRIADISIQTLAAPIVPDCRAKEPKRHRMPKHKEPALIPSCRALLQLARVIFDIDNIASKLLGCRSLRSIAANNFSPFSRLGMRRGAQDETDGLALNRLVTACLGIKIAEVDRRDSRQGLVLRDKHLLKNRGFLVWMVGLGCIGSKTFQAG
jgi:hypothetical protein